MNATQRRALFTACLCHATIHVYELAIPALLIAIQADYGAGDYAMGRVVTIYGLLFGLGSLPAGFLVDRLGARALLALCIWGSALAVIGAGLSPGFASFSACAAAMGLCLSVYHPAGTAMITQVVPPTGRVFALHGMMGNVGVAGSGAIAGLLGATFGWRLALVTLGSLGLLLGLAVIRLPRPEPIRVEPGRGGGSVPRFLLLLVTIACVGVVYRGVTTFLPKQFAQVATVSEGMVTATAGLLTTAALVVGLIGMWIAGKLLDTGWSSAGVMLSGVVFQIPFLVAIGHVYPAALLPVAMGFAFFHFTTQPAGNKMVAELTPGSWRGSGYGLYFFASFGAGSFGAFVGGWLSEERGLTSVFPGLAPWLIPSVVAAFILLATTMKRSRG